MVMLSLILSACGQESQIDAIDSISSAVVDEDFISNENDGDIYYLTSDNELIFEESIKAGELIILEKKINTNSERIEVENLSVQNYTVFLYNSEDLEDSIMQFELKSSKKNTFKNVTSAKNYQIGIISNETKKIELKITH